MLHQPHHWNITDRDETALLIFAETVLADEHHYAEFFEDIDDRGPLAKRLYDVRAGETLVLSAGDVFRLKNTCLDVLERLDHEDAARVDLAPFAYVLLKAHALLDLPVAHDGLYPFYATLSTESFRENTLVLCATSSGFTVALKHELKRVFAHAGLLEACGVSRRSAGNLRRAVDIARFYTMPDQDDETWFMSRENLEDLKRLLLHLKELARADSRFAPYRTTMLDNIAHHIERQ